MKKFIEKIKSAFAWIATDGLLHILVNIVIMLSLTPFIGFWWALGASVLASLGKEAYDFFIKKSNTPKQVVHDLICDGIGIILSSITILVWILII